MKKNVKDKTFTPRCFGCKHGCVVTTEQPDYETFDAMAMRDLAPDDDEFPIERVEEVYCSNPRIAGVDEPPVLPLRKHVKSTVT